MDGVLEKVGGKEYSDASCSQNTSHRAPSLQHKVTPSQKFIKGLIQSVPESVCTHAIGQINKWNPETKKISPDLWHAKYIYESRDDHDISLQVAEAEVFAQELKRALCPHHLFQGKNIFTKYRVAINDDDIVGAEEKPKIYVLSKSLHFSHQFGTRIYAKFREKNQIIHGLGICTFFGKFVGDIDLKFSNIGACIYPKPTALRYSMTQVDSGCAFAGIIPLAYKEPEWFMGYINQNELNTNPASKLNSHNYLESIQSRRHILAYHDYLEAISSEPDLIEETMVAALRCALLPPTFLQALLDSYFSKNEFSKKIKEKIFDFLIKHQEILTEKLAENYKFWRYFFSSHSDTNCVFIKSLEFFYEDLKNFIPFKKRPLMDDVQDFDIVFIKNNSQRLVQLMSNLSFDRISIFYQKLRLFFEKNPDKINDLKRSFFAICEQTITLAKSKMIPPILGFSGPMIVLFTKKSSATQEDFSLKVSKRLRIDDF